MVEKGMLIWLMTGAGLKNSRRLKKINLYFLGVALLCLHAGAWGDVNSTGILEKHFISITVGMKEKLRTTSTDSLIWTSTDTAIVTSNQSVLKAKSVGRASIIVQNAGGDLTDTCAVTVVPWIAGVTTLAMEPVFPDMRILSVKDDTLYMQGTGGGNGWGEVYFYKVGMNLPAPLCNFPTNVTSGTDAEHLLPTPFGNFIMAKRESINAARKIYKVFPDNQTNRLLYDKYPPNPSNPNYSYILRQGWSYDTDGNIYLGEYNVNPDDNYRIRIFKGSSFGETWDTVYIFPPRSMGGYTGGIRHIHACQVDPYTGDIWITTGDGDSQSRIYYNKTQMKPDSTGNIPLELLGIGSQEFRVVSMAFTQNYIYWFMDAPCYDQKIFRVKRAASYPTLFPSTPNDSDYRDVVGTFKDKPFYNNVTLQDSQSTTIFVGTVYENAALYGCSFREVDERVRIIGIRENTDKTVQAQEVFSLPAVQRYATVMPVGIDVNRYIYFDGVELNGHHTIYRVRPLWNDVDDISDFPTDSVTVFPNTQLTFLGNLQGQSRVIAAKINSVPDSGKVPDGIQSVSPYYWKLCPAIDGIDSGTVSVPVSAVTGIDPGDSVTWLARVNPGDAWSNIGGMKQDGNLISGGRISGYSELAIGSFTGIIGSIREHSPVPNEFVLRQNYPNPFNNSTTISFRIPYRATVSLTIFDVLGREVALLINDRLEAGEYVRSWNAPESSSGVFFCNLTVQSSDGKQNYFKSIKLILLK